MREWIKFLNRCGLYTLAQTIAEHNRGYNIGLEVERSCTTQRDIEIIGLLGQIIRLEKALKESGREAELQKTASAQDLWKAKFNALKVGQ